MSENLFLMLGNFFFDVGDVGWGMVIILLLGALLFEVRLPVPDLSQFICMLFFY
jgi:hypothetical protein